MSVIAFVTGISPFDQKQSMISWLSILSGNALKCSERLYNAENNAWECFHKLFWLTALVLDCVEKASLAQSHFGLWIPEYKKWKHNNGDDGWPWFILWNRNYRVSLIQYKHTNKSRSEWFSSITVWKLIDNHRKHLIEVIAANRCIMR